MATDLTLSPLLLTDFHQTNIQVTELLQRVKGQVLRLILLSCPTNNFSLFPEGKFTKSTYSRVQKIKPQSNFITYHAIFYELDTYY